MEEYVFIVYFATVALQVSIFDEDSHSATRKLKRQLLEKGYGDYESFELKMVWA